MTGSRVLISILVHRFLSCVANRRLPGQVTADTISSNRNHRRIQDMVWSEETILRLRELWEQGLSTAEIGRRLGVSKNAIVGKAHRLDLTARPSPIRREASVRLERPTPAVVRAGGPTLPPLPSATPASPVPATPP